MRQASRMSAGAVEQFIHEQVLLEQVSVVDPGTVRHAPPGTGVELPLAS